MDLFGLAMLMWLNVNAGCIPEAEHPHPSEDRDGEGCGAERRRRQPQQGAISTSEYVCVQGDPSDKKLTHGWGGGPKGYSDL